jgi:mRNA interferase MazF
MPGKQLTELPKRGDVILVPFPNSDLRTSKMRPALVVQSNKIETELNQLVVAMISSNMSRAGRGPRVIIESDESTGLLLESVAMTDNLATIRVHQVYG